MKNSKTSSIPSQRTHPVYGEPAFILERPEEQNKNVLVIADIHIGLEHALAQAGVRVPSQTESIIQNIINLCKNQSVKHLILLGDIKHKVPGTSTQEWVEIPEVFYRLAEVVESIDIIPGNHDGKLNKILDVSKSDSFRKIKFHSNSGTVLFGLGLFHGHTWPAESVLQAHQILLAHNHPHIMFVDKLGGHASFPCWVRTKLNKTKAMKRFTNIEDNTYDPEIIIMPAFNTLGSGTPVNAPKPEFLGPMLKNKIIEIPNSEVYLLDGTALGKLHDLIEPNFEKLIKYSRYDKYLKNPNPV